MTELFYQLLAWVGDHPLWSGAIIFLVAMAESVAIVGLIVPGVVIMFGIGALIAAGVIPFYSAVGWAVAGAVVGDGVSFLLGYRYRDELTRIWPFTRYPKSLDRGVLFFDRYGGKSVAFGRFFGPVRAVIPLVAGMMGMSPSRFAVANILSAIAWAPAYLLPGMVFGASLELASEVAFRLVALIVIAALLIWLSVWLVRRIFIAMHPHASFVVQKILEWGRLHPKMGEISAALADPNHPEAKGLSIFATLLILTIGIFSLLIGAVLEGTALAGIDTTVLNGLQSLRTPWVDHLMVALTQLTDLIPFLAFSLGMLAVFLLFGHKRTAQHWVAGILFCLVAAPLLKFGLQIPRPDTVAGLQETFSFPSGHTLRAVVVFGFLAVIAARAVKVPLRWIPYSVATILITAIALSRLYLGVHWMTDVLGSIALGLAWVAALSLAYHRHTRIEPRWREIAVATLLLLSVTTTTNSWLTHEEALIRYATIVETSEFTETDWIRSAWQTLPAVRQDTRQRREHPINIQYAGVLRDLSARLESADWQPASAFEWKDIIRFLSPRIVLQELPILPQVHDGRQESLILFKNTPEGGRLVLRLWSTGVRINPGERPIWIGNVTDQAPASATALITYAATVDETAEAERSLLSSAGEMVVEHTSEPRSVILLSHRGSARPAD